MNSEVGKDKYALSFLFMLNKTNTLSPPICALWSKEKKTLSGRDFLCSTILFLPLSRKRKPQSVIHFVRLRELARSLFSPSWITYFIPSFTKFISFFIGRRFFPSFSMPNPPMVLQFWLIYDVLMLVFLLSLHVNYAICDGGVAIPLEFLEHLLLFFMCFVV